MYDSPHRQRKSIAEIEFEDQMTSRDVGHNIGPDSNQTITTSNQSVTENKPTGPVGPTGTPFYLPDGTAFHGVFDDVRADWEKEKTALKSKYDEFANELSKIARSASRDTLTVRI